MKMVWRVALTAATIVLALLTASCTSTTQQAVSRVDAAEAVALIESGEPTVIDVRTPAEFAASHVQGAVNIDVSSSDFPSRVERLPSDGEYLVYCQSGNRSATAAEIMADLGFTDIVDGGGISDLALAGASLEQGG